MYNYLVVGSGLYGAIFAHEAKKAGKSVLVIDKRPNIAGNIYTEKIEGINVHKYGAHIFHIDSLVSMNMWGLTPDFLKTLEEGFKEFFEKEVPANPLKAEYLIPTFIGELLSEGKISVKALRTNDTWYGMTYKEDVAAVKESFSKMLENGTYKGDLFSDL